MIDVLETDDLMAPEVNADPYRYFGRLREQDPVHWNELAEAWVITRHRDVVRLTRNHELFSSAVSANDTRSTYPPVDEGDRELDDIFKAFMSDTMLERDRPDHLAMRQAVHRVFTPRAVEKWRADVRTLVHDLVDRLYSDGGVEAKEHLATPLPLMTICRILGVPLSDGPILRDLSEKLQSALSSTADRSTSAVEGVRGLQEYFEPLLKERAKNPRDDFISLLADGERRGVFSHGQVFVNFVLIMDAGHDTTINLICNGLLTFIRNPQQWDRLRRDPAGLCESATEECLRYEPSFKIFRRITMQDVELGGKLIPAGERLFWVISSANRDPAVFRDPDEFDITRSPNPHVAFGGGIHHCLGAALARVEGQEVFRALAERFPRLHLQGDTVEYEPNIYRRSLCALPIQWP